MTFKLLIKDYDSYQALSSKKIAIKNTDSKQSYKQTSNANGELVFEIEESQKGDFFSITIIDEGYEATPYYLAKDSAMQKQDSIKNTTQKILTPNNYQTHPAILYFKAHISLLFNGYNLLILKGDSAIKSYEATSDTNLQNGDYFLNNQTKIIYKDKDFTQEYIKISRYESHITLADFAGFESIVNNANQSSINLKISQNKERVESIRIYKHNNEVFADLEKPFAAGSYITLEALGKQIKNTAIFWHIAIKYALNKTQSQQILQTHTSLKSTLSLYLSSPQFIKALKLQGYADFTYTIYASSNENLTPHTPCIEFDLSFEAGEDSKEILRKNQQNLYSKTTTSSVESWSELKQICNLNEAVRFLEANAMSADSSKNITQYFKSHPQLAGKIAYIYFCFDLSKDEFVENATQFCYAFFKCEDDYRKDRDSFIKQSVEVFTTQLYDKTHTFKEAYNAIFANHSDGQNIIEKRKDFIVKLIQTLCARKNLNLPLQGVRFFFESDKALNSNALLEALKKVANGNISFGSYNDKILNINILHIHYGGENFYDTNKFADFDDEGREFLTQFVSFRRILCTIFHELRHFYIETKYAKNDKSALKRYIYWSDKLYIKSDIKEFAGFYKTCDSLDSSKVGCVVDDIQNAYEIQPSERDARFVETQILHQIQL